MEKYDCAYVTCRNCGLVQAQLTKWLADACSSSSAIAAADTELVRRNISVGKVLSALLYFGVGRSGRFVDCAGGWGLLTRLMRDTGYDFYCSDPYCKNMLAVGFDAQPGEPTVAITGLEVLEHLEDPLGFIRSEMRLHRTRTFVFTTELFEGAPPLPSWWYYAFATGQHLTFFQHRTLELMSRKLDLNLYSHGSFHMFTDKRMNPVLFRALSTFSVAQALDFYVRWRMVSRTQTDHNRMLLP